MPDTTTAALDDLSGLYLAVMAALDGAGPIRAQAALSMALLMTGEHLGFDGPDLIAWIDQTSGRAKTIARNLPARRTGRSTETTPPIRRNG